MARVSSVCVTETPFSAQVTTSRGLVLTPHIGYRAGGGRTPQNPRGDALDRLGQ